MTYMAIWLLLATVLVVWALRRLFVNDGGRHIFSRMGENDEPISLLEADIHKKASKIQRQARRQATALLR